MLLATVRTQSIRAEVTKSSCSSTTVIIAYFTRPLDIVETDISTTLASLLHQLLPTCLANPRMAEFNCTFLTFICRSMAQMYVMISSVSNPCIVRKPIRAMPFFHSSILLFNTRDITIIVIIIITRKRYSARWARGFHRTRYCCKLMKTCR